MLYVSRFVEGAKVGVVDTDDDSETIIYRQELDDAVLIHQVPIQGVEVSRRKTGKYVSSIVPQQDKRYISALQAKTKTLLGVDVRVFKNEVSAIVINSNIAKNGTIIRLSDFGNCMDWSLPVVWQPVNTNVVILVLDDKISLFGSYTSFRVRRGWNAVLDIREVTNEKVVGEIYYGLAADTMLTYAVWEAFVLDSQERRNYWKQQLAR